MGEVCALPENYFVDPLSPNAGASSAHSSIHFCTLLNLNFQLKALSHSVLSHGNSLPRLNLTRRIRVSLRLTMTFKLFKSFVRVWRLTLALHQGADYSWALNICEASLPCRRLGLVGEVNTDLDFKKEKRQSSCLC